MVFTLILKLFMYLILSWDYGISSFLPSPGRCNLMYMQCDEQWYLIVGSHHSIVWYYDTVISNKANLQYFTESVVFGEIKTFAQLPFGNCWTFFCFVISTKWNGNRECFNFNVAEGQEGIAGQRSKVF